MRAKIQGRKIINPSRGYPADGALEFVQTIISYIMTEILMVWQPSQHLNGVQGRSGLPTFCISAMILVALHNNSYATKSIAYL